MQLSTATIATTVAAAAALGAARVAHRVLSSPCDTRTLFASLHPHKFHSRVVWLTAAHQPLASALATHLLHLGASIILSAPSSCLPTLQQLARRLADHSLPDQVTILPLSQTGDAYSIVAAVTEKYGRLDVVVVDTVAHYGPHNVNEITALAAIDAALPALRLVTGWGAVIVHISSLIIPITSPLSLRFDTLRSNESRVYTLEVHCSKAVCVEGPDGSNGHIENLQKRAAERVLAAVSAGLRSMTLATLQERLMWAIRREKDFKHQTMLLHGRMKPSVAEDGADTTEITTTRAHEVLHEELSDTGQPWRGKHVEADGKTCSAEA